MKAAAKKPRKSAGKKAAPVKTAKSAEAAATTAAMQVFRDLGCRIVSLNREKHPGRSLDMDPGQPPQDDQDFEAVQNRVAKVVEYKGRWGILMLAGSLVLVLDWDSPDDAVPVSLTRFFNRARRKYVTKDREFQSMHGFLHVVDADHAWCVRFARRFDKRVPGLEVFAEKHWVAYAGAYANPGADMETAWYNLHDDRVVIQVTKADLEDAFGSLVPKEAAGAGAPPVVETIIKKGGRRDYIRGDIMKTIRGLSEASMRIMQSRGVDYLLVKRGEWYAQVIEGWPQGKEKWRADMSRMIIDALRKEEARRGEEAEKKAKALEEQQAVEDAYKMIHEDMIERYKPIPIMGHDGEPLLWTGSCYDGKHNGQFPKQILKTAIRRAVAEIMDGEDTATISDVNESLAKVAEHADAVDLGSIQSEPGRAFVNGWLPEDACCPTGGAPLEPNKPEHRNLTMIPWEIDTNAVPPELAAKASDPDYEFTPGDVDVIFGDGFYYRCLKHNFWLAGDDPAGRADFDGMYDVLEHESLAVHGGAPHVGRIYWWLSKTKAAKSISAAWMKLVLNGSAEGGDMPSRLNTCNVSLQEMGKEDSRAVPTMPHKLLNIVKEVDHHKIEDTARAKSIAVGEDIPSRELYHHAEEIGFTGCNIMLGNQAAFFPFDEATLLRFHVRVWGRQYLPGEPGTDPKMKEKVLASTQDIPRFIAGLRVIRDAIAARGEHGWQLRNMQDIKEVRRKYESMMKVEDPLLMILENEVEFVLFDKTPDTAIRRSVLMGRVEEYCKKEGIPMSIYGPSYVGRMIQKAAKDAGAERVHTRAYCPGHSGKDWLGGMKWRDGVPVEPLDGAAEGLNYTGKV